MYHLVALKPNSNISRQSAPAKTTDGGWSNGWSNARLNGTSGRRGPLLSKTFRPLPKPEKKDRYKSPLFHRLRIMSLLFRVS